MIWAEDEDVVFICRGDARCTDQVKENNASKNVEDGVNFLAMHSLKKLPS